MENITLVMMETSNSFEQVMQMKLGVFLGTIKQIKMHYLMQNPEWRKAYLKHQAVEALKSGKIAKQTQVDLQGLMSLQSSL